MLSYNYTTILKVAMPLMVSSFIQSIILITDAIFISRYDTLSFDAVGNGGLLYITLFVALQGLCDGSQILMARRVGQANYNDVGRIFSSSIINQFFVAMLLFAIMQLALPNLLMSYTKHKDITLLQIDFINIRSFALFFAFITLTIQAFYFSIGKTWVVLIFSLIVAGSNILLSYSLIFGKLGMPEMGIKGAALANTIADGLGMLFLVFYTFYSKEKSTFSLFKHFKFSKESSISIFKISSPLMLQGFIGLATWTFFFSLLEQVGKFELTVSQNVRSLYFLALVPVWGFAGTTKTYISQYIGKKDFTSIKIIQNRIQFLNILFLVIIFHGAILYPETLVKLINPNELYIEKSAQILRFVSGSILIYTVANVYFQTINGSGNTMVIFKIELISAILYSIVTYLLIIVFQVDVIYMWLNEYAYFTTIAILSITYIKLFEWKKKEI